MSQLQSTPTCFHPLLTPTRTHALHHQSRVLHRSQEGGGPFADYWYLQCLQWASICGFDSRGGFLALAQYTP